jgi:predicted acyltransferase
LKKRIESVDILRGFAIIAMILVNTPGSWSHVYSPLSHAEWHGLTPTDLIFPFFLFIVGISITYAYKNKPNTFFTYKKIFIRSLKLIGLGVFINLFLPYVPFLVDLETLRLPGVLQRIGVVFFVSGVLYLNFNWKSILGISVAILIFYWLLLGFAPLLNGASPTFDRAPNNWVSYVDYSILGSHMWQPDYDPEGIISTLPAIVTCLSGILIGKLLVSHQANKELKLFGLAIVLLALGYIFNVVFPINKALWSSSYVLVTSGWAILILSIIYYISDVRNLKFGSVFKYVGMNAITIYFVSNLITKTFYLLKVGTNETIHSFMYNSFFIHTFLNEKMSSLLYAMAVSLFYMGLGYLMYKRKVFIKV